MKLSCLSCLFVSLCEQFLKIAKNYRKREKEKTERGREREEEREREE